MEEIEVVIHELIWDDWNIEHIANHNVTPDEVERSLTDEYIIFIKAKHGRIMTLGRAGRRLIATVLNAQKTMDVLRHYCS